MCKEIDKFIHFLKEKYALNISVFDSSFLEKGIRTRMDITYCNTFEDYLLLLHNSPTEKDDLLFQLSNSYSEFFRNPLTFAYLEQIVLPALIGQKLRNKENEIRIWSAACASGQEAYSLAILFDEMNEATKEKIACRIFATDINQQELTKARFGDYQSASVSKVTLKRIQTYFTQSNGIYHIVPHLREYINFSTFDLLAPNGTCPPASIYGNFDLVFCSNLLFYFRPEYRQRILDKTINCLAPGGFVITGEVEREILKEYNFREVYINSGIFQIK